jgi:cytochrome P450
VANLPKSEVELFSDEALENPYPLFKELRDTGPTVYLARYDAWFIGRYALAKRALSDWQDFSSAQGTGLNPIINEAWKGALIFMDPPEHTERRRLMTARLGPKSLKPIEDKIDLRANELALRLSKAGSFDAVADLACDLPINIIMDLVGWPQEVRPYLLDVAAGSFDACGPANARMQSSLPRLQKLLEIVTQVFEAGTLDPDGFASTLANAAKQGEIDRQTAIGMLIGYVVAAFDTTINGMANGTWLFASNPNQWDALRESPKLLPRIANEIIRMECPLQFFSRVTTRDIDAGEGVVIPKDARVIIAYGSANRDERQFANPDKFDIARNEAGQLGFGAGAHNCAGQNLARMEIQAVFGALSRHVRRFELVGSPERALNNITRGFRRLPVRVERLPVAG